MKHFADHVADTISQILKLLDEGQFSQAERLLRKVLLKIQISAQAHESLALFDEAVNNFIAYFRLAQRINTILRKIITNMRGNNRQYTKPSKEWMGDAKAMELVEVDLTRLETKRRSVERKFDRLVDEIHQQGVPMRRVKAQPIGLRLRHVEEDAYTAVTKGQLELAETKLNEELEIKGGSQPLYGIVRDIIGLFRKYTLILQEAEQNLKDAPDARFVKRKLRESQKVADEISRRFTDLDSRVRSVQRPAQQVG